MWNVANGIWGCPHIPHTAYPIPDPVGCGEPANRIICGAAGPSVRFVPRQRLPALLYLLHPCSRHHTLRSVACGMWQMERGYPHIPHTAYPIPDPVGCGEPANRIICGAAGPSVRFVPRQRLPALLYLLHPCSRHHTLRSVACGMWQMERGCPHIPHAAYPIPDPDSSRSTVMR